MKRPGCWDAGNQDQGNDSRPDTVEYFHHPDIVLKMIEKQSDGQYDTKGGEYGSAGTNDTTRYFLEFVAYKNRDIDSKDTW